MLKQESKRNDGIGISPTQCIGEKQKWRVIETKDTEDGMQHVVGLVQEEKDRGGQKGGRKLIRVNTFKTHSCKTPGDPLTSDSCPPPLPPPHPPPLIPRTCVLPSFLPSQKCTIYPEHWKCAKYANQNVSSSRISIFPLSQQTPEWTKSKNCDFN